jgi:membrane-bound inhibitor of C-type lysozyme
MAIAPAAALFVLLSTQIAVVDEKPDFRCENGMSFRISFSGAKNNYEDAWLVFTGTTRPIHMKNQHAGSGSTYVGGRWMFQQHHQDTTLADITTVTFNAIPCHALPAK